MKNYQRQIVKMLEEISKERNFKFNSFSESWLLELEKNGVAVKVVGYQFENNLIAEKIATDKSMAYEILSGLSIPATEHVLLLPKEKQKYVSNGVDMVDYLNLHKKIVAKPNQGTGGEHIFKVSTKEELESATTKIMVYSRDIALSPYIDMDNEWRGIVLNGEILLTYRKIRKENCWQHNLSKGARAEISDLPTKGRDLIVKGAKSLGLDFCSVDLCEIKGEFSIAEINSGVMLERFSMQGDTCYEISKEIYEKAIEFFYERNKWISLHK